jgi:hypothetical protein
MNFTINRLALLKALQSVRVDVAEQQSLASLFEVSLQATDAGTVVIAAEDIKRTIDAEVTQSGTVCLPIKRFSRILQSAASETAEFTMGASGEVEIVCGAQTYHLGGTSGREISYTDVPADTALRIKRPRRMTIPMVLSIALHVIFVFIVLWSIKDRVIQEDAITLEWVDLPQTEREIKKPIVKRIQPKVPRKTVTREVSERPQVQMAAPTKLADTIPQSLTPVNQNVDFAADIPDTAATPITTAADLPTAPDGLATGTPDTALGDGRRRGGGMTDGFQAPNRGTPQGGGLRSGIAKTGATDDLGEAEVDTDDPGLVPKNKLGAVLRGEGPDIWGHIRLIRLKHSLADWWQDPTAIPSFIQWLKENTQIHADMNFAGGALSLTDPRILDAPFIVMTGHDKKMVIDRTLAKGGPLTESFTLEERAALRKYIVERGGMLFFDDCGFKGLFAAMVTHELQEVFPEYGLENIDHDHEIYNIYYQLSGPPTGGDVFWESEDNPKVSPFKYHKGISIGTRLAVVFNRKDYLCAMETAEIESRTRLRLRRSTDVHRFMTNLLVYAMRRGGNTDRSQYKR